METAERTDLPDGFFEGVADGHLARGRTQRGKQVGWFVAARAGSQQVEQSCQEHHLTTVSE